MIRQVETVRRAAIPSNVAGAPDGPSLLPRGVRGRTAANALTGIDIGGHSAKLVARRWQDSRWCIVRAHCLRLPASAFDGSEELADALRSLLKKHGEPACRELVVTLPSHMVDYESVELPSNLDTESADCALAVCANEAMQRLLGDEYRRATYDYWVGNSGGAGLPEKLHLTWTASEFATRLAMSLARDGWRVRTIDAAGPALANIAAAGEGTPRSQLAIDIGADHACFVSCRGAVAENIRSRVRFASMSAAETLAAKLGVRAIAAEQLLRSIGIGDASSGSPSRLASMVHRQLLGWLEGLAFEVQRTTRFLRHRHPDDVTEEIVLCGGGACVRGLGSWLAGRVGISARDVELPAAWRWETAEPFSPLYAGAVAMLQRGGAP